MHDTRVAATSTARPWRRPSCSAAYTYNLDTVSRRGGPEGEVSSISRTPLRLSPPLSYEGDPPPRRLASPEAVRRKRGDARGCGAAKGGLLRPSVSSRLVSRDGLVSRQPSSVRIDTPATLTTPTSSTFYCEKQCTYRPRARASHLQPPSSLLSPPSPRRCSHLLRARESFLSLAALPPIALAAASCQRALSLVESS